MISLTTEFELYANSVIQSVFTLIDNSNFSGLGDAFDQYQALLDLDSQDFFTLEPKVNCAFQILSAELFISVFSHPSKQVTVNTGHLLQLSRPLAEIEEALLTISKIYNMQIKFIK